MGAAGEMAEKYAKGPGSFQTELLDQIYGIGTKELAGMARVRQACCQEK